MVALVLICGGGWFAYRSYQQNRPHPVWVPLPIRADVEMAERDKAIKELKTKLGDPLVLTKVSMDLGLVRKWNLPSEDACARELEQRLFVRAGDADTPMGKVPAILIGVNGKEKESALSGEIAVRLMDDVARILGIKLPPKPGK